MLRILRQCSRELEDFLRQKSSGAIPEEVKAEAAKIVRDVMENGDEAVMRYSLKYDGFDGDTGLLVGREELETAAAAVDSSFISAIKKCIGNVSSFHKNMLEKSFNIVTDNGSVLGSRVTPLEKVAVYVPGGKAPYPSTVVMCAIPAIIAGVEEIILLTPPRAGGIDPYIAATAKLIGIDSIFRVGGAHGIAAAAFGTGTIPKVDKIVGPGNAYVAAAKREVFGYVDIDMIAGPSEIAVIADDSANAAWVAADLLSQAEHDELARCFLVTNSEGFAAAAAKEAERQLGKLGRKAIAAKALMENSAVIVVKELEQAAGIVNRIAPEHLEIITENPFRIMKHIKNAGAIFLGDYSTEPIGDYIAGTNHVLPTNGTSAFFSPLSTGDFQKRSSLIFYSREDLLEYGPAAVRIAEAEGLEAHAAALKMRLEGGR